MTELAILMIKTVVTTIDVMFGAVLICGKGGNQKEKIAYSVFMLGNIVAMWIQATVSDAFQKLGVAGIDEYIEK